MATEEKGYMELMGDLISRCPNEESGLAAWIAGQKEAIEHLAAIVEQIPMFLDSQDIYREFLDRLDAIVDPEERLRHAWRHILEKAVAAPTTIHLRGVVIMCVPALKYALDGYLEQESGGSK